MKKFWGSKAALKWVQRGVPLGLLTAVALLLSLVVSVPSATAAVDRARVVGAVTEADGTPVADVQADLFVTNDQGGRGRFLGTVRTERDGRFGFDVEPGCYTVTVIAPEGRLLQGRRWYQPSVCVRAGEEVNDLAGVLDPKPVTSIEGTVSFENGDPADGVQIDLFSRNRDGGRNEFLETTSTDPDGTYRFDVAAGCYVATFIAPEGQAFDGSRWYQSWVCVDKGKPALDFNAVLDGRPIGDASLGGQVTDTVGAPVAAVKITLWETAADGSRSAFLGSLFTGQDGRFSTAVPPDCYWLIYIAPDGESFNGGQFLEVPVCVDPGEVRDDLDAMLDGGSSTDVTVSVGDASVAEGTPGQQTQVDLFLTLSAPAPSDLSVRVATTGGTATPSDDYQAVDTIVTVPAGQVSALVPIVVLGDDVDEDNETVLVSLTNPSAGLIIGDGTGQLTIVDDDGQTGDGVSVADQTFSVGELSSAGTAIGTVAATADPAATLTYSLDDNSEVAIDSSTGQLTVVDPLLQPDTTVTVEVTVGDGSSSATATLTIDVARLTLLPNPNSTPTTSGALLEVEITGPADRGGISGGPLTVQGQAGIGGTTGNASVTYVMDVSLSTNSAGNDCNGDGVVDDSDNFNPEVDNRNGSVLDCEIAGLLALNRSLADSPVEVSLVIFAGTAVAVDVSSAQGIQGFTTPTADENNNGTPDIEEALAGIGLGTATLFTETTVTQSSTNFPAALTAAADSQSLRGAGRTGFVFFLSDGRNNAGSVQPAVDILAADDIQVNTYSVGLSGTGCDEGTGLRIVADGTGGVCVEVDDPGVLSAVLTDAPQGLESILVSVDGGPAVNAPFNALGQWSVEVPQVDVDRHVIRATVRANDGTEIPAEILIARIN